MAKNPSKKFWTVQTETVGMDTKMLILRLYRNNREVYKEGIAPQEYNPERFHERAVLLNPDKGYLPQWRQRCGIVGEC